jgi:hexosaminidase
MKHIFVFLFFFSLTCFHAFGQQCPVIPAPEQAQAMPGTFTLRDGMGITFNDATLSAQGNYLQQQIFRFCGMVPVICDEHQSPAIRLVLDKSIKHANPEAYTLNVRADGIKITAAATAGVFRGMATLLQLLRLSDQKDGTININCWAIKDAPRFTWRGIMLDESRHFFGMQTVKELLDWMAFYKLNKFHWHLTDEPAWRMEVKAYPLLSLNGGVGTYDDALAPAQYYTQEQIKEVIDYAAKRFIEVIPEIDMPGHATAANKAYPVYSGGGAAKHPEFTFNPGLDSTYNYLGRILRETDMLFPSQMIHLGGDEVSFGNEKWKTNPGISRLMKTEQLADLVAVEHYFTHRMADTVFKLNNKVLLWDEAADTELPRDKTIIFWWRHDHPEQLKKALDKGYSVVLCPRLPFYFDFMQDANQRLGRKWQGNMVTLDKLYGFTLRDLPVSSTQVGQIQGVQAGIWTEYISTREKLEYMLFPRIAALAETGWTPEANKNLDNFYHRLSNHLILYGKAGIYYYNPFNPQQTPEPLSARQISALTGQAK